MFDDLYVHVALLSSVPFWFSLVNYVYWDSTLMAFVLFVVFFFHNSTSFVKTVSYSGSIERGLVPCVELPLAVILNGGMALPAPGHKFSKPPKPFSIAHFLSIKSFQKLYIILFLIFFLFLTFRMKMHNYNFKSTTHTRSCCIFFVIILLYHTLYKVKMNQ